jgi:FAD/FMN-containing dehydrogenase/Fe-S oxidoreductase
MRMSEASRAGAVRSRASDAPEAATLESALRSAIRGDVEFGSGTRAVYATDSSNYRQVPIGVVFPRDEEDTATALRICAEHDVPVFGRGAGTSLAGQACNKAVVFDFSRHMNKILEIDRDARLARVQPGVVLDDLRRAAERHGLTFGPDPATHAWCTLGGMIGNNSCGTHALYAGKTVDNVERLRVATYGGAVYEFGGYDDASYAEAVKSGAPEAGILGSLREIGRRAANLVEQRYPQIPRRVSGFNLDQIGPDRPLHAARLLVGTESTCVLVTEAVLRLVEDPAHRRLVVVAYPSVFDAADAVPSLLGLLREGLIGLEGFDVTLVRHCMDRNLNATQLPLLPGLDAALKRDAGGWLLAEVGAQDRAEADRRTDEFIAGLAAGAGNSDHRRFDDAPQQRLIWAIRESGLAATAIRADGTHNLEGWEDAAVAPERLGEYLRRTSELWEEFGYSGAWYGHFGQGCVHTRNNFDLQSDSGRQAYRAYVERAADLVISLGGSLSGEHGDGQARGELLERMYGRELVDAFRQVKAVFDPRGRMNPGKVVDPAALDANLRFGPDYRAASDSLRPTHFPLTADSGSLQHAAERCVGVGRCRRDDTGVMCPSYRATRDERHSTRGRAKLLAELFQGDAIAADWRSGEVREALDLCLACKGCAVDCPTGVDMATYKAEFFAHHYRGRLRPRSMYALGFIPWLARIASRAPTLANASLRLPVLNWILKRSVGVTTRRPAPRFARRSLRRSQSGASPAGPTVVLWPDTFTDAYRPEVGVAWRSVLEAAGERVMIPTGWACCARPLYDTGMLALARRSLQRLVDILDPFTAQGIPIIIPEPSCLASFRDELPALLHDDPRAERLAGLARSPAEHLLASGGAERLREAAPSSTDDTRRVLIHPHCHARAIHAENADRDLLQSLGFDVSVLDAGCCGLAGSFGFTARHESISRSIGEEQWLPKLLSACSDDRQLVLDGFSCATQFSHLAPAEHRLLEPTTLAQLILASLDDVSGAGEEQHDR